MRIICREVIGNTGDTRVDLRATQFLGGHFLARRRFHQGRAA